ncbi:MAG TPA: ribosome silencing factor [Nitrospirales bacterium]|nr:ribosome silencing factor [Nitrospirales bacterium]
MAARAAEEKKASEIMILDVALKSGVTDYFLICSAESERQVIAVKDHIEKALDEKGYRLYGLEGLEAGVWVLMDYDDVVVHIFKRGVREHYGLDRLWADAKRLPLPKARAAVTAGRPNVRMSRERTARQRG